AAALREGWLHTGDGAWMDDEGRLFIADRLKDMIITGGENVFSAEVEAVLMQHAAVASCAVIVVPSEQWGEAGHAVGVLGDRLGERATRLALQEAGLDYRKVQQAVVGYVYGDSTAGQGALYRVGMSGIPIFNVDYSCGTGSSALFLARQAVESGAVDCALALG